jgi:hypothetical protein
MANAPVALDGLQTLQVQTQFASQVALSNIFALLNSVDDLRELRFRQVLSPNRRIELRLRDDLKRVDGANAVDIAKRNVNALVARDINTKYACHKISCLTLPLLVTGVRANHANDAFALHDLAVLAHFFYRCPNFHSLLSFKTTSPCDKSPGDNFTVTIAPIFTRATSGT